MTELSTLMYAMVLAKHFDALIMWPFDDQPTLLPWAIMLDAGSECSCGLVH